MNTKEDMSKEEVEKVVDRNTEKLERSGHSRGKILEIATAGIRGQRAKEGRKAFV